VPEEPHLTRRLAALLLARLDDTADLVGNGIEALAGAPCNVVLMDVQMRELDGSSRPAASSRSTAATPGGSSR
jgi:CheY-like chemotaxis protein